MMRALGAEVVDNAADFRLMSRRALEELAKYEEVNLFLRGIVPQIGLKSTTVEYRRAERLAGKSKYSLRRMLKLAWDGITSFSVKPMQIVLRLGILVFIASLIVTIYAVVVKLMGQAVSGWAFTVCSVWLLGGMQMMAIGLIGEYIGKIYAETKRRPKYTIEMIVGE